MLLFNGIKNPGLGRLEARFLHKFHQSLLVKTIMAVKVIDTLMEATVFFIEVSDTEDTAGIEELIKGAKDLSGIVDMMEGHEGVDKVVTVRPGMAGQIGGGGLHVFQPGLPDLLAGDFHHAGGGIQEGDLLQVVDEEKADLTGTGTKIEGGSEVVLPDQGPDSVSQLAGPVRLSGIVIPGQGGFIKAIGRVFHKYELQLLFLKIQKKRKSRRS